MKSINILIPYFGKFPNYFQLFLESCAYNYSVNWTIFTDCTEKYDIPQNVQIVYMTFYDVQQRIKHSFDFNTVIDSVHKLCEYKPAYGYLFPEYIKGFDYWGYGDIDLIYGDIRKFLSDEVLEYDKIFQLGHFSLIKNCRTNNVMFMRPIGGEYLYKKAFSSKDNYNFDESFFDKKNINTIFEENNCSIWERSYAADIYTKSSDFILDIGNGVCEKKKNGFFLWNHGTLGRYHRDKDKVVRYEEFLYIHLQKRKMKVNICKKTNCFKIIPNEFSYLEIETEDIIDRYDLIRKKRINNQYFVTRYRNLLIKLKRIIRE